jgi:hypothetical protein
VQKMRAQLPKRTQVEVLKPNDVHYIDKYNGLGWLPEMDKYIGTKALVDVDNESYIILTNKMYNLTSPGSIYEFDWHRDWVKVISKDENGHPQSYDNEGRTHCYWCHCSIKKIREKVNNLRIMFAYCPECKR